VADDQFNNQDEVIRYTDGAFRPYNFVNESDGEDRYFLDVVDDNDDTDPDDTAGDGNFNGENFDTDGVQSEAILAGIDEDEQIDGDTVPITTGLAALTNFTSANVSEGELYIYDSDDEDKGDVYEPGDGDFIFVDEDNNGDYNPDEGDTIVVGSEPGGSIGSNMYETTTTDLNGDLYFLDGSDNEQYDYNSTIAEPIVFAPNANETGDPLPHTAEFFAPGDGIDNNYGEQYDEDREEPEEGAEPDGDNDGLEDIGLQSMASTDTLFLDDGAPDQSYSGEDGEDEDIVDNDLQDANVLVDGEQDNFKGEDIGPNADGNNGPSEDFDDAVIRGQNDNDDAGGSFEYYSGLNLYTEPDGDNFEELVLVNEIDDNVNEGSSVDAPGPDESGVDGDTVYYGDAMVDLTVTNTGSAENDEDIAGATLYRETDGESGLTSGDTLVKASTF